MKCPKCGATINPAAMLGSISTPAKAQAARENAKLGGWPKGKKRGKRKRVARRRNAEVQRPRTMKSKSVQDVTEQSQGVARGSLRRMVGWRVWHVERRKWCFGGQEWETRKEAERAKVNATRGQRNTLTNFFRIAARIVPVLADGTSPLRDDIQKEWDSKMRKPANNAISRKDASKPL